jgi:ABC-type lipoprotein export system ATPase subunit
VSSDRDLLTAPPGTGAAVVELHGIHKRFRRGPEEIHAVRGASLSLHGGEVVALVGPSGSGKTTLLNVMAGWEEPDEGRIVWHDGSDRPPRSRTWSELAIIPQDLGLLEELSVRENVELPVRLGAGRRRPDERAERRVDALLRAFGLDAYVDRAPSEISLGEQQRVALSRALALRPTLLLADEPTGHQDAGWARTVFRAFRVAAREGTGCLVATHSREFLRAVDRILAIRDGEVHAVRLPEATPATDEPEARTGPSD